MEKFHQIENQLDWQKSLEKIKEYLKKLLSKRFRKNKEKIIDETNKEIKKVTDDDFPIGNINFPPFWWDDEEKKDGKHEGSKDKDNRWGNTWWAYENDDNFWEKEKQNKWKKEFDTAPEDQDEYIPQDMEMWEALWDPSRFAEIYPPFFWYYSQWKKSYFDRKTNLWSKKKKLSNLSHSLTKWTKKLVYTWVINAWITSIPLPDWALPDTNSLHFRGKNTPTFQIDQNWCVYLISKEKTFISFNFWLNQYPNVNAPIPQDSEKIIFDKLSPGTQELLNKLKASWMWVLDIASAIKYYIIKNKKYSVSVQGTLRNKSNKNNYVTNLDESPILECFSANVLFVALCRELWIPARLSVWHYVDIQSKEWKALIWKDNWHAWSEIWDSNNHAWVRFDATPTKKENWEDSNENGQERESNGENSENNNWNSNNWEKWEENKEKNNSSNSENKSDENNSNKWNESNKDNANSQESDSKDSSQSDNQKTDSQKAWEIEQQAKDADKTPWELLDEMIEKAKEESLINQAKDLEKTLDDLSNASSKEDIKKVLEENSLTDFAKELVDSVWNDKILEEEKNELEKLDDEKDIDKALKDSLLDEEYKNKLREYAKVMKEKIENEKRRMKKEMEEMWFSQRELGLYKEYKQLEREVEPEVRRQIRELKKILPVKYQVLKNKDEYFRSWIDIDWNKLIDFLVDWDSKMFRRNEEVREWNEINMFETILIDTSWSMWNFWENWSILRESVKAAIIRAKVLEHFKVEFSIVLFWDRIDEVMSFWEKFSSSWKCPIPSKLMRAAYKSWWNSREPISYVYQNMLKESKKRRWKSFGNITFIGDGDLYQFNRSPQLKGAIEDLRRRWFWVTAYYINNAREKMPLIEYYFWTVENWWAVYAKWVKDLWVKIIESHKTNLKKKIKKYMK